MNKETRRESRKCLPDFYKANIAVMELSDGRCENCGLKIKSPDAKNVAHILMKSTFPSVQCHPSNSLHLCTGFDGGSCHEQFDTSYKEAQKMDVWPLAVARYMKFKDSIKEKSPTLLVFMDAEEKLKL